MSDPAWQELRLSTCPQWLERLEDWLFSVGAVAVSLEDAANQPLLEPGPGQTPIWDSINLTALFPIEVDLKPVLEGLPEEWLTDPASDVGVLIERDWERAWMDQFHPMAMGDRLWVCPSWCDPPDPAAVNLILDPGLAFGSGTHPTTAMCLRALDSPVREGMKVVDYGCGRGVLAIAALKLGAASALGIDNDPQALTASRDNATWNSIALERLCLCTPTKPDSQWMGTDIVVANILANPLIELAPDIEILGPGCLLLAGLLDDQADEVAEATLPSCRSRPSIVRTAGVYCEDPLSE